MSLLPEFIYSHLLSAVTAVISILMVVKLLASNRAPQSLIAWILALTFVPLVAIPCFLLFGSRKFPRTAKRAMGHFSAEAASTPPNAIARTLQSVGAPPLRHGNDFELLGDGERAYTRLHALIDAAQHTITVNMFIVGDDAVGWSLVDHLAERAKHGLDVRLVLDAVGSAKVMRRATKRLAANGGEARSFMPLMHAPVRGRTNLRCHRKLAVFDDAQVFLGGMNLAREYMGETPSPGRFVDIAAVVSGPSARDATAVFESDWVFCGGAPRSELALRVETPRSRKGGEMQLVPSGPDMAEDTFYNGILTAFATARERIAIVTPYYVPDEVVQRALTVAARRGVHTQLLTPSHSNHALADFARRGLLRELEASGVELQFYPHGMVHAKAIVVDDAFAFIGSPNMDMRSLFLNYEDALFIYDRAQAAEVTAWVDALLARCTRERPHSAREHWFVEQLARIVAPEL
jgi:cardiolipin synthase